MRTGGRYIVEEETKQPPKPDLPKPQSSNKEQKPEPAKAGSFLSTPAEPAKE